jgi:hypothetical protein
MLLSPYLFKAELWLSKSGERVRKSKKKASQKVEKNGHSLSIEPFETGIILERKE